MKQKNKDAVGSLLVLLAGILWGSMGLFVRRLSALGFDSIQITAGRLGFAALLFWLLLLLRRPKEERAIRLRDLPLFLGLGLASILFFTVCYFAAIAIMPLSTAAILLYTSPIWVTLLSALLFHERLTAAKLIALGMAFGGCVLVSGLGGGLTLRGLLLGLGAGLGYGLYSILGSIALRHYSPYTVTAWTFLIAGIGALCICRPAEMLSLVGDSASPAGTVLFFLLTAFVTAVIPFLSYTLGLRSVEAGKAAILATVEPMVASLLGVLVFREALSLSALLGILLILGAVVLLSLPAKKE